MTYTGPIWEGVYDSFSEVPAIGPGFDGETWIDNSLNKITALQEEAAKNVPLPPVSNYREALLPLLASLVYNQQQEVSILDFGGGIGLTYSQTRYSLPRNAVIDYHIVERESVCRAGREYFGSTDHRLVFDSQLPPVERAYDIVHCSSALQYIDDWQQLIARLCALSRNYLLLVDVPAGNIPTFVTAQHYHGSKIPARFLNITELLARIKTFEYELIFSSVYMPVILGMEHNLPMQNFEEQYRLQQACNLLLKRNDNE